MRAVKSDHLGKELDAKFQGFLKRKKKEFLRMKKIKRSWNYFLVKKGKIAKLGGLDLSRRDLDRDLDLDAKKKSVSTVEKISTVFKS